MQFSVCYVIEKHIKIDNASTEAESAVCKPTGMPARFYNLCYYSKANYMADFKIIRGTLFVFANEKQSSAWYTVTSFKRFSPTDKKGEL